LNSFSFDRRANVGSVGTEFTRNKKSQDKMDQRPPASTGPRKTILLLSRLPLHECPKESSSGHPKLQPADRMTSFIKSLTIVATSIIKFQALGGK
jgi:hypothetical protein